MKEEQRSGLLPKGLADRRLDTLSDMMQNRWLPFLKAVRRLNVGLCRVKTGRVGGVDGLMGRVEGGTRNSTTLIVGIFNKGD
jgi:hypothetical protein